MAEGGGALRELIAFLGFDVDTKGLDKADERLKSTLEGAKRVAETIAAAFAVNEASEFIESQIQMGVAVEHTSQALGIGIDELQEFQYAAATVGVGTDEANTALKFLSKNLGDASLGNAEAAKTFQQLHVATKNADGSARDMNDVLLEVSDAFEDIKDPAVRTATAIKVFGRQGAAMVPLLKKGGQGIHDLGAEFQELGGGLSEQFIEDAAEAEHGMVMLHTAGKGLSSEIGAVLLPYVAEFAGGLAHLVAQLRAVSQHTNIVRNTLITLAVIAGVLVVIWGIMNIEILVVVAALALLALAVDDVITFVEGGDSVLGRFIDKIYGVGASKKVAEELKDAWKEVSDAFQKLWDAVKSLGPDLKKLFDTFTKNKGDVSDTKTGIQGIADAVTGLVTNLTSAVTWFDNLIKKFDDFAKAHPLLVHAAERELHQVGQGNVGVVGALKAVGGDVLEAATGDTSINSYGEPAKNGSTAPIPFNAASGEYSAAPTHVQQQNTSNITFYGVPGAVDAANKLNRVVTDAHTDANNAAFSAVGGGAAP